MARVPMYIAVRWLKEVRKYAKAKQKEEAEQKKVERGAVNASK